MVGGVVGGVVWGSGGRRSGGGRSGGGGEGGRARCLTAPCDGCKGEWLF